MVRTCRQTPCFCGQRSSTGDLVNFRFCLRLERTNWLIVGMWITKADKDLHKIGIHQTSKLKGPVKATVVIPRSLTICYSLPRKYLRADPNASEVESCLERNFLSIGKV
jgi:hypothetical protein